MPTPKEVAEWMIAQLEEFEELLQQDAAGNIQKTFGSEFVYRDDYGDLAIDRRVLYQFRKLTGDKVVWVARQDNWLEGFWRNREPSDKPGRRQTFW